LAPVLDYISCQTIAINDSILSSFLVFCSDVNVGYQFVNLLYRDSDGQLGVDVDLINDVREQTGGGGEPLIEDN